MSEPTQKTVLGYKRSLSPTSFIMSYLFTMVMEYLDPGVPQRVYATPDTVAMTLGLQDPIDPASPMRFSDESNPTYEFVDDLIRAAEDQIDRLTQRTWREYKVTNRILDIRNYQWDENAYRGAYYQYGGYKIELQRDLLPWDPSKGDRL